MSYSVNRESSKTYSTSYQNQAKKDADAKAKADGTPTTAPKSGPSVPVLDKSGSYTADSGLGASTSGTGPGGVEYDAYVEGPKFELDGNVKAEVGTSGVSIDVNVDINAQLLEAGASAEKTFEVEVAGETFEVTLDLAALGEIGANGSLNLSLDIGPGGVSVSADVEGFAGARGSITGGITLTHEGTTLMSGEATLSASAGVSGSAGFDAGFNDGKIEFEASAEATVGAGFGFDVDGSIDAKATANAVAQVFTGALRDGVEDVAETAAEFAENTGEFLGDRAEDLVDLAEDVGGFVIDAGGKIVDGAVDAGKNLWEGATGWL